MKRFEARDMQGNEMIVDFNCDTKLLTRDDRIVFVSVHGSYMALSKDDLLALHKHLGNMIEEKRRVEQKSRMFEFKEIKEKTFKIIKKFGEDANYSVTQLNDFDVVLIDLEEGINSDDLIVKTDIHSLCKRHITEIQQLREYFDKNMHEEELKTLKRYIELYEEFA